MTGGLKNPLGALALYLGNTLYRIHGTNDPTSIGRAASSGCFRMMNEHVLHLASIANVGTPVTVLKHTGAQTVSAPPPAEIEPQIEPQDDPYAREPEQDPDDDPYDFPRGYDRYQRYDRFGDPL